jgi:hypothetical protein
MATTSLGRPPSGIAVGAHHAVSDTERRPCRIGSRLVSIAGLIATAVLGRARCWPGIGIGPACRNRPYGAAAAAHGIPGDRPLRSPPYPAAAPISTTAGPVRSHQMHQEP